MLTEPLNQFNYEIKFFLMKHYLKFIRNKCEGDIFLYTNKNDIKVFIKLSIIYIQKFIINKSFIKFFFIFQLYKFESKYLIKDKNNNV